MGSLSLPHGSSRPRARTKVSCLAGGFLTMWSIREAICNSRNAVKKKKCGVHYSGVQKGEGSLGKCILTYSVTDYWTGFILVFRKDRGIEEEYGAGCPEISRTLFKEIHSGLHKIGFTPLSLYAYCLSKGRALSGISTKCWLNSYNSNNIPPLQLSLTYTLKYSFTKNVRIYNILKLVCVI